MGASRCQTGRGVFYPLLGCLFVSKVWLRSLTRAILTSRDLGDNTKPAEFSNTPANRISLLQGDNFVGFISLSSSNQLQLVASPQPIGAASIVDTADWDCIYVDLQ